MQPVIELRPFNAPGHSFSTRPRKTQCENFWKYIIKNLSPGTSASATCLKLIELYYEFRDIFQKNDRCFDSETPT